MFHDRFIFGGMKLPASLLQIRFGDENESTILNGKLCPYCGSLSEYVDSSAVYGTSYGMIYRCRPCDAYVGVHEGTDKALGSLSNYELREARKEAHYYFNQIALTSMINEVHRHWIGDTTNRSKAYRWLSKQMNVPSDECHIGMFDVQNCRQVVEICKPYLPTDERL